MQIRPREARHFLELTSTQMVGAMVKMALDFDWPTLVLGDAGTGKTTALVHYSAEHNALYCHASHACKTVKGLHEALMDAGGWWVRERSHTRDLQEIVYSRLDRWGGARGKLVIVDEVQNLGLEALRELLNIQETCRLPMVLSGNDKRLAQVKTHGSGLDQIISRIGARVHLRRPSEDCLALAEAFGVKDPEAVAMVSAFGQETSLRDVARLLEMVATIAGSGSTVARRHVDQTLLSVYGSDHKRMKAVNN